MNPLDLDSPHHAYPRVMVLEVFWGVFEGYTGLRVLVEAFAGPFSLICSPAINQIRSKSLLGGSPPPGVFAPGCVLAL